MEPLAALPRGGPRASRLDRWFETDAVEYLDLPAIRHRHATIHRALDRFHRLSRGYRAFTRLVLRAAPGPHPRILELGAGGGRLATELLRAHPTARLTVSDVDPGCVARLRAGPLGRHPRATVRRLDATAIDAPDRSHDLAVLVAALHHLDPVQVAALLREGTRVAGRLLLVDGWRHPGYLALVPLALLLGGPAHAHDFAVSVRRVYAPAALHAIAEHGAAGVALRTGFRPPGYLVALATARTSQ
ncbi:class I SAM-dependent methyltransferase [Streptomyces sp. 8K308]|uniref:class I SAM-dependent methyltransferase n=1 Tax=Streptomyces sp. 8K308 TaxID=2530388 RepID=UPI00104C523A|nr:class I SAM-dependent methyltransferase [Streptomyces sp. 8K308]TDC25079.1 class I SAM-dependent methyltransferase [Streptomyces sp. 8K308]